MNREYPNTLHNHRKNTGMTQVQVARALGLKNTERIAKWENGHCTPLPKTLFRLAYLYHVESRQLFREVYATTPLLRIPKSEIRIVPANYSDEESPFKKNCRPNLTVEERSTPDVDLSLEE